VKKVRENLALLGKETRRFYIIVAIGIWASAILLLILFLRWFTANN